ncbi:hypothetical protein TNCV_2867871 [Trichonephila clavipes]|nr:hypothetical protein TNCV_2867871 [Trichonephila clavipes]
MGVRHIVVSQNSGPPSIIVAEEVLKSYNPQFGDSVVVIVCNATRSIVLDRGPRNSSRQHASLRLWLPAVLNTMQVTVSAFWLRSNPILKENIQRNGRGVFHLSLPSTNFSTGHLAH